MRLRCVPLAAWLLAFAASQPAAGPPPSEKRAIQNLRAFAKLYGYVRFFHPSDEASALDWDRFAYLGVQRVRRIHDRDALVSALDSLFLPIAPTVQIYRSDAPPPVPGLVPADTTGLRLVAWQHQGVNLGFQQSPYRSGRLNRGTAQESVRFGTISQSSDAASHRGKEIKLTAVVRAQVDGAGNQAQLWLRVDRPNGATGFFDNMQDRPIRSTDWTSYEIIGKVDDDATRIVFGGFLLGKGQAWFDDFELLVKQEDESWSPLSVENPGFEAGESGGAPSEWWAKSPGYRFVVVEEPGRTGHCVSIDDASFSRASLQLFEEHPQAGECVEKRLGDGLMARIPLALYGDSLHTLGGADPERARQLAAALPDLTALTADDADLRLADVVIAWNVFQHFYPYFDVVDCDWDAVLSQALTGALREPDLQRTLEAMVAQLQDGHGRVSSTARSPRGGLPFLVDWIEDRAVIVATSDSTRFARGDVVESVDGVSSKRMLRDKEQRFSGSPQWRRYKACATFGSGERGSIATIELRREERRLHVQALRDSIAPLREARPAEIAEIRPAVFYVDLARAEMSSIEPRLAELAESRGVIFDLRGYPKGNHDVLRHLTDVPLRSARWQVPRIIYPDRERIAGYDTSGVWLLTPEEPRFRGRVVFMTDGRAISYAESCMGIVEHYRLGEIVGQPTAGTNGNVNMLRLPGGFQVSWTGMRVLKHDGSRHHLVGIQPTVSATRTLRGVREGRDEVLEKALEIVERSKR